MNRTLLAMLLLTTAAAFAVPTIGAAQVTPDNPVPAPTDIWGLPINKPPAAPTPALKPDFARFTMYQYNAARDDVAKSDITGNVALIKDEQTGAQYIVLNVPGQPPVMVLRANQNCITQVGYTCPH